MSLDSFSRCFVNDVVGVPSLEVTMAVTFIVKLQS